MGRPHTGQRGSSSAGTRISFCSAAMRRTVSSLSQVFWQQGFEHVVPLGIEQPLFIKSGKLEICV